VFDLLVIGGDFDSGSSDVFLRLKKSVDRETQSVFALTLVALDSGTPRRTGSLSVSVAVTDANDHAPTFNATRYQFTASENLPPGSVIGRVLASDADDGDNARVTYTVTRVNGVDATGDEWPVGVDPNTGDVVVVGELDFEGCAVYVLTVAAVDWAPPQLRQVGYTRVIVHVVDVNDNAPEVTTLGVAEVAENSRPGKPVLKLAVSDADSDQAGQIRHCRAANAEDEAAPPAPFSLQRITPPSHRGFAARYVVVTEATLDRESRDLYSLLVTCVDAGVPPLTGRTVLDVRVSDVNDNAPRFGDSSPRGCAIPENNDVDDYITTIEAADADVGANGTVSYSIRCFSDDAGGSDSDSSVVRIDNVTGVVRAVVSLDRELHASYDCVVVAVDGGIPPLSASTHLQLTVTDVDDEHPVFERRHYEFQIVENLPAASVVGRVKASDADEPPFNDVFYSLDRYTTSSQALSSVCYIAHTYSSS